MNLRKYIYTERYKVYNSKLNASVLISYPLKNINQ